MSTPDGEPLLGADYESREMSRDMDLGWHVPRIAADRELVKAVLKEYMVRLMFQGGGNVESLRPATRLYVNALEDSIKEYFSSKIVKESHNG